MDEFHAVFSIQLGELIKAGIVDFSDESWNFDSYNEEQRNRLYKKLTDRYFYREIGILPILRWKTGIIRKLNELMPKYKFIYKALESGASPYQVSDEYGKRRNVFSEFPQTQLGNNQDFASTGTDEEYEKILNGNFIEITDKIKNSYNDVDVMILDELETFFSCLLTVNMNSY